MAIAKVLTVRTIVKTIGQAQLQHWPGLGNCLWGLLQVSVPGISSPEHLDQQGEIQTHIQAFTAVGVQPQFLSGHVHLSGHLKYPTTWHLAIPELVIQGQSVVETSGSFLQHAVGT